jgi:cytochrome c oxidase subunit I
LPFFWNVVKSRKNPMVNTDDPWGWGRSLEWATSCPPPRHNFTSLPRIRSESPAFDLHHPEVAASEYEDNTTPSGQLLDAGDDSGRAEELVARTRGESDDPAVAYEAHHPSQSPEPGEGDRQ